MPYLSNKPVVLYVLLLSLFLTFLLMAELTGSKLFTAFGFTMTMGVIPFPVTFIITDLLNEYFGRKVVRTTTIIGMIMIGLAYVLIVVDMQIPANPDSPISDSAFNNVFANSGLVIIGSVVAYLIGQFIDIQVFHFLRKKTKGKHIWLRATGSTILSQLIDSYVVIFIALGKYHAVSKLVSISNTNFLYKLGVAILITPLLYLVHMYIDRYLGENLKKELTQAAMEETGKENTIQPA
ncbi:queuosine precursor transporter [Leptospira ilyithenensis]|uniref:Probable queuosine precursor transporter n=1 Tax=Leptospira ilyithenensis TaxID=2484901 RepID=A0A4V3JWU6_9LEPT|nr:queuosine precursor transporter [Leptospira ilyithenensis]TGN08418.1 VUT family protein [Leptospira ilyithenensis]